MFTEAKKIFSENGHGKKLAKALFRAGRGYSGEAINYSVSFGREGFCFSPIVGDPREEIWGHPEISYARLDRHIIAIGYSIRMNETRVSCGVFKTKEELSGGPLSEEATMAIMRSGWEYRMGEARDLAKEGLLFDAADVLFEVGIDRCQGEDFSGHVDPWSSTILQGHASPDDHHTVRKKGGRRIGYTLAGRGISIDVSSV